MGWLASDNPTRVRLHQGEAVLERLLHTVREARVGACCDDEGNKSGGVLW